MWKRYKVNWIELFESIKLPLKIVVYYLIFGGLWILFSDRLLGYLVDDRKLFLQISVAKGWFYVLVTGALLLKLIHHDFSKIQNLNRELNEKNDELMASNEETRALYEEVAASEETLQASYDDLQSYREQLESSDERYKLVMAASQEGFWDYHPSEQRLEISDTFSRIFGLDNISAEDILHQVPQRIHPDDQETIKSFLGEENHGEQKTRTIEFRIRNKNGGYRWAQFNGMTIRNKQGEPHRIIGAIRDIHEKIIQRERIEYYAFHDPSTGFHNRDFMLERLNRLMEENHHVKPFTFLVAGIQGMDRLSSVYGTNISEIIHYQVGMAIWKAIVQGDNISMMSLGRFGIILDGPMEGKELNGYTEEIDRLTKVPIKINQLSVSIQMVYGAVRCEGMCEPEVLMQQAETAFNHAVKELGREHVVWYDPALQEEKTYLGKVEFLLRQALEANEFSMVYQPQVVDSSDTGLQGYEALLRWNNEELGSVSPEVFIPVAEATGQIEGIGEFVIASACRFIREFMDSKRMPTTVSINASLMELINPEYIHRLLSNLDKYGLEPKHLNIEITESALAKYLDSVIENLKIIRDKGFEIHLDDFGTGYSSLNHLGRLPVHALKIDRTFVWQMETDPRMKQMTELIIRVGHQLDLRIIAEGVESESQYRMLQGMGCDSYQGFYFSRPIPEYELLK